MSCGRYGRYCVLRCPRLAGLVTSLIVLMLLTSHQAYADCQDEAVRCIGPGEEYDTAKVRHVENAFQDALNRANPGDTLLVRGGVYRHDIDTSPRKTFMRFHRSGTADAPITMRPFEGEKVIFEGFGFEEDVDRPSRSGERLAHVTGNYVALRDMTFRNSTRNAILVDGSHGTYEGLTVHDNWMSNIIVRGGGEDIEGNVFREVETYRSRYGSGIWVIPSSSHPNRIENTVIEDVITYRNGYKPNGQKVLPSAVDDKGGKNSDGIGVHYACSSQAHKLGEGNLCGGTIVRNTIAWGNADDGFDTSAGGDSVFVDNVAFDNGPEGGMGFKVLRHQKEGAHFHGNIAFTHPSSDFELFFGDTGSVFHNTAIHSSVNAFRGNAKNAQPNSVDFFNNLSAYNIEGADWAMNNDNGAFNFMANHIERWDGDPMLSNPNLAGDWINTSFAEDVAMIDKHNYIHDLVIDALMPRAGSPLVDAGVFVDGLHCAHAADDPLAHLNGPHCRAWYGLAPDIGAVESFGRGAAPAPVPAPAALALIGLGLLGLGWARRKAS